MIENIIDQTKKSENTLINRILMYTIPAVLSLYALGCGNDKKSEVDIPREAKFDSVYTKEPITIKFRDGTGYVPVEYKDGFFEVKISPDGTIDTRSTDGKEPIRSIKSKIDAPYASWIDSLQWYAKRVDLAAMNGKFFDRRENTNGTATMYTDQGKRNLTFTTSKDTYNIKLDFAKAGTLELQKVQDMISSVLAAPSTVLKTKIEKIKK